MSGLTADHLAAARVAAGVVADYLKASVGGAEDYDVIRADFINRLTDAFLSFVSTGGGGSRRYRSAARAAVAEDFPAAFYAGYKDAGGKDTEPDDESWLTAKQGEQLNFMNDALSALRAAGEDITEPAINTRVEMWGNTLDSVYSEGKLRGAKNMMCYFDGDDGAESCETCQDLKNGPPRSIKWIIAHDMKPYPGNKKFDCGGWRCEHGWRSVKTDEWITI